jgi:hypothetical protein
MHQSQVSYRKKVERRWYRVGGYKGNTEDTCWTIPQEERALPSAAGFENNSKTEVGEGTGIEQGEIRARRAKI